MIDQYIAAWNSNGLEEFKAAFALCWAADAKYTDPAYPLIEGVDGIAAFAQLSLEKIPSRKFKVLIAPSYHHQSLIYTWQAALPGETRDGLDYIEYSEDFKIKRLVSFFPLAR